MDDFTYLFPLPMQLADVSKKLAACNQKTAQYSLSLSEPQLQTLLEQRNLVLKRTGRIELGEGILIKLMETFCSSPYLSQHNYETTLKKLQELFYYFKNESMEQLSDDELLRIMKDYFDHKAHGSLDYLANTLLETVCHAIRTGQANIKDDENTEEDSDNE